MAGKFSFEEYFRATVEKKLYVKVPEQEDHDLTPATRLLEKRREMQEVEQELTQQKEEFTLKMEALTQRREELTKKESQLQESLLKFERFLKENDAKRARAVKKSIEEKKVRELKEGEMSHLKVNLKDLSVKREKQSKCLENHVQFQRFLEGIVESNSGDFGEVKDILGRYDTLSATNAELLERAHQAQDETERSRLAFAKSCEEKNNQVLNYNNDIARLKSKLEDAQNRTVLAQQKWDGSLNKATEKSLLLGQVKMATANLYNVVRSRRGNRMPESTDPVFQLEKLEAFISDLNDIGTELRR